MSDVSVTASATSSTEVTAPAPASANKFTCELCKKSFAQKGDFTRHKNKKAPCISLTEIQQMTQAVEVATDQKSTLINVFKRCLNILRDGDGLTGEKALRNLSYLLILKMVEPRFGVEIDIDGYNYDFSDLEEDCVETIRTKLLHIVRFSNLATEKEDNLPVNMRYLWQYVLAQHPTTKNIFLTGKSFDMRHQTTYKKIIDVLHALDLSTCEYDVLGNAYEEVIQDIMTGKVLGQFFTPPLVKKMMVKLIDPQLHPDGTMETCGDPTMGTGGFLITCLQHILQQAQVRGIEPNWGFIQREGIYGKELEPDTYQLAVSNMLITSGHMFSHLDQGDSIRDPITRKLDNILANPPFGIKGMKYDDFRSSLRDQYVPIKSDNAVSLFVQAIIYMLKLNGKCAVVLPDGQDLFSKTNTTLIAVREYLMKTCDLKEIIYLPSGIFTYTCIKTCVFYFVKKREGTDVLETQVKVSKTQRETGRSYKFTKTLQTTKVAFYDYNPYTDVKNLLVEVPIERIVANSYALNYAEYVQDEGTETQYAEGVVVKTLGEVCFINFGTDIVKRNAGEAIYPVYGSGRATFYTNTFNREGFNILVGRNALSLECVRLVNEPIFLNDTGLSVKPKDPTTLLHKYLGYYLLHNQSAVYGCARGCAQKVLAMEFFKSLKIPVPPLARQQEIVDHCEYNETRIKQLQQEIENNKRSAQQLFSSVLKPTDTHSATEHPSATSSKRKLDTSPSAELFENFQRYPKKWEQSMDRRAAFESQFHGDDLPRSKIIQDLDQQTFGHSCTVVDIGSKNGEIAAWFRKNTRYAFQNYDYGSCVPWVTAADLMDLSEQVPDNSAQVVILQRMVRTNTLSSPDDDLREASRMLLPNGTLYIVEPVEEGWREEWQGLLEDYGFEVMRAEECEAIAMDPATTLENYKYLFFKCVKH